MYASGGSASMYDDFIIGHAGVHDDVFSAGVSYRQVFNLCVGVMLLARVFVATAAAAPLPRWIAFGVVYTNAEIVEAADTELDERSLRELQGRIEQQYIQHRSTQVLRNYRQGVLCTVGTRSCETLSQRGRRFLREGGLLSSRRDKAWRGC